MSQNASAREPRGPVGGRLGVMDAMRMGWQFMKRDFWATWVVGLVALLVISGVNGASGIPYIGPCISLVVSVFVGPPLAAGIFLAFRRVVDGSKANVGDLFNGFRERYWESVVALLLPTLVAGVLGLLIAVGGMAMGVGISVMEGGGHGHGEEEAVLAALAIGALILVPLVLVVTLFSMFFVFSALAVWDCPRQGWQAAKASMRLVWANFWSVLGLMILFGLVSVAALLVAIPTCCIGALFTVPVVMVWQTATYIYLYRSWTGQPLVQGASPVASGPVAPSEILPPPPPPPPPPPGQGR